MTSATDLAQHLGITKTRLRNLTRDLGLSAVTHWVIGEDARTVFYTPEGVAALHAALALPENADRTHDTPEGEKPAPEAATAHGDPLTETLTVVSLPKRWPDGSIRHLANPRLVLARRADGSVVPVRVSDSRHFAPISRDGGPMTLTAAYGGEPAPWYLVGRCPRYLGRY